VNVFIALGTQHAIFLSVPCMALQNCFTLFHNRQDFRKRKVIEYETSSLEVLFVTFLILRRKEQDVIRNMYWS